MFKKLITPQGLESIKAHRYVSGECSKLDKFISNKVNYIVPYVPETLTPNMITTIGFLIHLSSSLVFLCYGWDFDIARPNWTYAYAAISLFIY